MANATKAHAERAARIINREFSTAGCRAFNYEGRWCVLTDEAGIDSLDASYALADEIPGVWSEPVNGCVLALIRES